MNNNQLRAGIDLIISSIYFEESARSFRSNVIIKEKIDRLDGKVQRFKPHEVINEHADKVIQHSKELNEKISQLMIKKRGNDPIVDMAYDLIESFRELSYLSIPDQQKVKEFINNLKNK